MQHIKCGSAHLNNLLLISLWVQEFLQFPPKLEHASKFVTGDVFSFIKKSNANITKMESIVVIIIAYVCPCDFLLIIIPHILSLI